MKIDGRLFLVVIIALALIQRTSADSLEGGVSEFINLTDTGFRPEVHGFGFENYGNDVQTTGMTPSEMQRMFGDRVVASAADDKIILTFPAKRWMDEANKAMAVGHCEGMAVLSTLFYYNKTRPFKFGGTAANELSLQNELLQQEIAYWWTTQATRPGGSVKINESPNVVLNTLTTAFNEGRKATEWWVIHLYRPDGSDGHSVTPYAVENMGNGTARILVYDNNLPNIIKAVEIDQVRNTWKYNGSTTPNEPYVLYAGNASTQSLQLVSISSRLVNQECEFCDEGNNSGLTGTKGSLAGKRIQVWVDGKGAFNITDKLGRRIGILESGTFVNEIPNAERTKLTFQGTGNTNLYRIPFDQDYSICFGNTNEYASLFFPGHSLGIDNQGKQGCVEFSGSKIVTNLEEGTFTFSCSNLDYVVGPIPDDSVIEWDTATCTIAPTLGKPGPLNIDTCTIVNNKVVCSSTQLNDVQQLNIGDCAIEVTHPDGKKETIPLACEKRISTLDTLAKVPEPILTSTYEPPIPTTTEIPIVEGQKCSVTGKTEIVFRPS